MKKAIIFSVVFPALISFINAQDSYTTKYDTKINQEILTGKTDREGLQSEVFGDYFTTEYEQYSPDEAVLAELEKADFSAVRITIVMGSWCSDSQREVPRFYNVLDRTSFDDENLVIICVDSDKNAEGADISTLNILKVPTFIIFIDDEEAGRIIESPSDSLEKDLLNILQNKK